MAKGILTNREVKNKVTGVDIYVSDYQEVPHRLRNEYLYHVIVVSNLFYYKTREHRESDVVQFMVSKTFAEFEDLYKRLFKRFPSVHFPPLPEKSLFSQNPAGHLACMDKVLKLVASTLKLSSSPMVISFLRGDALPKELPDSDPEDEPLEPPTPAPVKDEDTNNEFQDVDLFEKKHEEVVEEVICAENVEQVSSGKSIFDDDDDIGNDEDLFGTANTNVVVPSDNPYDLDAELDALELSDEADELMNLSKTSEKQLSIKVNKPPVKKMNQTKRLFILDDDPNEKEDMFKKASKSKSLWGDDNHHRIDDIFGVKKTSIFDDDDDDDIFLRSIKKKEVKVDEMKQQDIDEYIKDESVDVTVTEKTNDLVIIELQTEQMNVGMVVDDHRDPIGSDETVPVVVDPTIEEAHSAEITVEHDELFSDEIPPSSITLKVSTDSVEDDSNQGETCNSFSEAPVNSDPNYFSLSEQAEAVFAEQSVLSMEQVSCPVGEVVSSADTVVSNENVEPSHIEQHVVSLETVVPCESTPPLDTTVECDIPSLELTESSHVEPETISQTLKPPLLTDESLLEPKVEVISLSQTEEHTEQLIEDDISASTAEKVSSITERIDNSHKEYVDMELHDNISFFADQNVALTLATEATSLERTEEGTLIEDTEVTVSDVIMSIDAKKTGVTTMLETEAGVMPETEGDVMLDTEGELMLETEGELMLETEGELMLETEGDSMLETEGDSMLETEGDLMLETEGDLMLETEGDVALETEGEILRETADTITGETEEGAVNLETDGNVIGGMDGHVPGEVDGNVMEKTENVNGETESSDVGEMQHSVGQISLSVTEEFNNSDVTPSEQVDCVTSAGLLGPSASTYGISLEADDNILALEPRVVDSADNSVSDFDNSEISAENTSMSIVEETHLFATEFCVSDGPIIPEGVVIEESDNSVLKGVALSEHVQDESLILDTSCSAPNNISDVNSDDNDNVAFDFSSPDVDEENNNEQITVGVNDPSPTNLVYSVNLDL